MVTEDTWYDFNLFVFTKNYFVAQNMIYTRKKKRVLEKNAYSFVVGYDVL